MADSFQDLLEREQKGSRARCILLTDGVPNDVAARLTKLIEP